MRSRGLFVRNKTAIESPLPGPKLASTGPSMKKAGGIHPIKNYSRERFARKIVELPEKDDLIRKLRTELGHLSDKVGRHADQQRRLREEITEEIRIWTELLENSQQVSYDYIKRRISALKGSLEYPGIPGFEAVGDLRER